MKLPTDPKERTQILVLIGLVAVGVCVGIFFAFKSLADSKKEMLVKIEELDSSLSKADAKIKRMQVDAVDNEAAVKEILDVSEDYVLTSVLGNYQLVARDILEGIAKELELEIEPVRELGQAEIPYARGPGVFNGYTARVTLFCGMHDLVKYLQKLEAQNPYLCVTGITIVERHRQSPNLHQVSFDVQWPVWSDPELKDKLVERSKGDSLEEGGAQ